MARTGRPKIQIDQKIFEGLCGIQCTLQEITSVLNCSEYKIEAFCKETYSMNFQDVFKKYSASGKVSLRRNQFNLSKTNAAMAIFLGKQYLGQRDVVEELHTLQAVEDDPLTKAIKESIGNKAKGVKKGNSELKSDSIEIDTTIETKPLEEAKKG